MKKAIRYYSANWEVRIKDFTRQCKNLNKIFSLGEEVIINEYLLGGDDFDSLQSYIFIIEFKIEVLAQCKSGILEARAPFLKSIGKYKNFVKNLLGAYGHDILKDSHLKEGVVLYQWGQYVAHHFVPTTKFNTMLTDRYSFFTSQCIHAEGVIDNFVNKWEQAKQILKNLEF